MSFTELKIKNDFIKSMIESRFSSDRERLELKASDHSDIEYMITSNKGDKIVIINAKVPHYEEFKKKCQIDELLSRSYGKAFSSSAEDGYNVRFEIDTEECDGGKMPLITSHIDFTPRKTVNVHHSDEELLDKYSLIGRYLCISPYLWAFKVSSKKQAAPPLIFNDEDGGETYVLPLQDRVLVCFGLHFSDEDDKTLAKVFLTEFSNCKNSQNYSSALQLYCGANPPKELSDSVKKPSQNSDISYATFVFLPLSYSSEKKIETCADRMFIFRTYLRYHIKASKVMMHTRMRNRVSSFIKILNRAKQEVSAPILKNFARLDSKKGR